MIRLAVLCISDRSNAGTREDLSGPAIIDSLNDICETVSYEIVPDERPAIEEALIRLSDKTGAKVIITTGGTGFGPRDVTPEATLAVSTKMAPGIAEAIRAKSLEITPYAMLSRAVSAIRGNCLIINFPGSPKACRECSEIVRPILEHAVKMLNGGDH